MKNAKIQEQISCWKLLIINLILQKIINRGKNVRQAE